jgi:hypothetical protein
MSQDLAVGGLGVQRGSSALLAGLGGVAMSVARVMGGKAVWGAVALGCQRRAELLLGNSRRIVESGVGAGKQPKRKNSKNYQKQTEIYIYIYIYQSTTK